MLTVSTPSWNPQTQSYSFPLKGSEVVTTKPMLEFTEACLPDTFQDGITSLLTEFIEKSKQWFASPLKLESSLRRLKHRWPEIEKTNNYAILKIYPEALFITAKDMTLSWVITSRTPSDPLISSKFFESTTPRAQSPVQLRTIQIQNTVDSSDALVAVNDLPLSDILEMESEVKAKTLEKQRIREARLKVALAKLKAERMAQKYYSRYGEELQGEDDSELSSASDSDEHEEFAGR